LEAYTKDINFLKSDNDFYKEQKRSDDQTHQKYCEIVKEMEKERENLDKVLIDLDSERKQT
jgi:hypothetical protein